MLDAAMGEFARLWSRVSTYGARRTAREELDHDKEKLASADGVGATLLQAGQSGSELVGVMLTITLAAVIGFIGIKVNAEVQDSVTDKDLSSTDAQNQTVYENASESISGGFSDAMGLTDIVFLVLMFTVIIGALLAFRSR